MLYMIGLFHVSGLQSFTVLLNGFEFSLILRVFQGRFFVQSEGIFISLISNFLSSFLDGSLKKYGNCHTAQYT